MVDFICEIITIFFATRIRNHVSWSRSGSVQMIQIRIRIRDTARQDHDLSKKGPNVKIFIWKVQTLQWEISD